MVKRITIDPVTRIEGHLRIDVEVDNGKVQNAWSSGTMWRGIETIVQGRDPRDAWVFVQRICGVCTTVHAMASVRSVEDALGIQIPLNAQLIRNLIITAHALHDHIVHFYLLSALDWVDVVNALKADPAKAAQLGESLSDWPGNSKQALAAVKEKIAGLVGSGQLGIFQNGYWGHPAMKLPPEVNLLAVAHYLQALDVQRKANQVVAVLGSKTPNIQNLAVGGVANAINLDNPATLNMERLLLVKTLLEDVRRFVQQCYFTDVAAIASFYPDWLTTHGVGVTNYLAVPDLPTDASMTKFDLPGGILWADGTTQPVSDWKNDFLHQNVTESIAAAYYEGDVKRNPWQGQTQPKPPQPGALWKAEAPAPQKYSWVKAPRLKDKPVQVGPVAQVLVGYQQGHERIKHWADKCLDLAGGLAKTKFSPQVLRTSLGRHAARAIRAAVLAETAQKHWQLLVDNIGKGDTTMFTDPMATLKPGQFKGVGFHEAPRGTLSHWCVIDSDGKKMKLTNYQAVVPSTWNAGPRDEGGVRGPYEESLIGNPVADPKQPLEALRTIHSFDPCLACAIHAVDADGQELAQVKVL
jgi:hydrogenase large subunit